MGALQFLEGVEDLSIEQFVPEAGIEALSVSVLPRRAWLNVGRPGSDSRNPVANRQGNELRAVI